VRLRRYRRRCKGRALAEGFLDLLLFLTLPTQPRHPEQHPDRSRTSLTARPRHAGDFLKRCSAVGESSKKRGALARLSEAQLAKFAEMTAERVL
jgi:hypothetical protein